MLFKRTERMTHGVILQDEDDDDHIISTRTIGSDCPGARSSEM
jgi:hypothetical protein